MTKDKQLFSVANGKFSLCGKLNLHITKIEVFTGDDEYRETDCVEITALRDKLNIKKYLEYNEPSSIRSRSEPGIRVFLASEDGGKFFFQLGHHKGGVDVQIWEFINQSDAERYEQVL